MIDVKPLPRGAGFQFDDQITGGVVPKQLYSRRSRKACSDGLKHGPLGFPVVDSRSR